MPEAVIVSAARSPIGRAFKGSLKDLRPDDLTATIVRAALDKIPELDPRDIDDLYLGCGLPGGESGFNMGRIVSVLLGYDHLPGATITRYCSSSVQTTRMAFHAIKAGEGDVFISRRRRDRLAGSPRATPTACPDTMNPVFADAKARTDELAQGGAGLARPARGRTPSRTPTSRWARPPRTSRRLRGLTRQELDEFGVRSQNLAEKAIDDGFWAREITPVTTPDGTVVSADDGPRAGVTLEGVAGPQAGVPSRRRGHGRQLLRAQRRRRRGGDHVRHEGRRSSASPRSPGSSPPASPACPPRSWASARSRRPSRR